MKCRSNLTSVAAAGCCVAAIAGAAPAADFPTKPIRLLCSGVGGGGDFTSRLIGPHLASRLGQPVVVDNRPGGVVPGQILAGAQADGHTLMLVGAVIWLSPFMRSAVPFDPVRDFAPVTLGYGLWWCWLLQTWRQPCAFRWQLLRARCF